MTKAIILTGGKSSRMGLDECLMGIHGMPCPSTNTCMNWQQTLGVRLFIMQKNRLIIYRPNVKRS